MCGKTRGVGFSDTLGAKLSSGVAVSRHDRCDRARRILLNTTWVELVFMNCSPPQSYLNSAALKVLVAPQFHRVIVTSITCKTDVAYLTPSVLSRKNSSTITCS